MGDLRTRITSKWDIRDCCVLILTKTRLLVNTPDSAVSLQMHFIYQADHTAASGKKNAAVFAFTSTTHGIQMLRSSASTAELTQNVYWQNADLFIYCRNSLLFSYWLLTSRHVQTPKQLWGSCTTLSTKKKPHTWMLCLLVWVTLTTAIYELYYQSTTTMFPYQTEKCPHFGQSDHILLFLYAVYRQILQHPPISKSMDWGIWPTASGLLGVCWLGGI